MCEQDSKPILEDTVVEESQDKHIVKVPVQCVWLNKEENIMKYQIGMLMLS